MSPTYDLANRLTKWNNSAVSSDLSGNMTSQGGLTYVYNARNQLTQVKQQNTTLALFAYDSFGRRVAKTLSGAMNKYVFDGSNVVQEQNASEP